MAACSSTNESSPSSAAGPASAAATPADAIEDARVQEFLDGLYGPEFVRRTFVTPAGQTIDCVDVAQERGVRDLLEQGYPLETILAPFKEAPSSEPVAPPRCPEMTVAHVRITAAEIAAAGGLDAYRKAHSHRGHPTRNDGIVPDTQPGSGGFLGGDRSGHGHVVSEQQPGGIIYGGTASVAIAPPPPYPGPFWTSDQDDVIGQIWVSGGSGLQTQTVEVGWKTSALLGPLTYVGGPYLFVGATQDDYTPDFCENGIGTAGTTKCVTWVSNPSSPFALAESLAPSMIGGTQRDLLLEVQLDCVSVSGGSPFCMWDVIAGGLPAGGSTPVSGKLGYFALSGYGSGALGRGQASVFESGGEVYDVSGSFNQAPMGEAPIVSGKASYGQTAYVHDFGYFSSSCNANIVGSCYPHICRRIGLFNNCPSIVVETGANVYTTQTEFTYNLTAAAGSPNWTNWFYYGDKQ